MRRSATAEGAEAYFQEYVFGVADFDAYLEKIGGMQRLDYLREVEAFRSVAFDRFTTRAQRHKGAQKDHSLYELGDFVTLW